MASISSLTVKKLKRGMLQLLFQRTPFDVDYEKSILHFPGWFELQPAFPQ